VLSRLSAFAKRNPVTPLLVSVMGLVLLAELWALGHSKALFEYLYVAQGAFTPGLVLAPLSHATFYTHYGPNMILFLLFGWSLEARLDRQEFLGFVGAAAYLPTCLQVLYSVLTSGTAATLGFSGAVFAVPPLVFCLTLQEDHSGEVGFGEVGNMAFIISVAIPLVVAGVLDILSTLPGAKITHGVGYVGGLGYGLMKLRKTIE
jgi:membrane associated rhomboid family serine protease